MRRALIEDALPPFRGRNPFQSFFLWTKPSKISEVMQCSIHPACVLGQRINECIYMA